MKVSKFFASPDFMIKFGLVVVLIIAMISKQHFGFYAMVHWFVTISSVYFAKKTYQNKEKKLFVFFAVTAILFNPIFEFSFTREAWQIIDFFVTIIIALSIDYDYMCMGIKEKNKQRFSEEFTVESSGFFDEEIEIKNINALQNVKTNPNIFQKIAIINYITILVFIFTFFVPNEHYNKSIFNSYEIEYFKFLIYIVVPTIPFIFLYKYFEKMNLLELSTYKIKGKFELNILFVYLFIVIGTVLFCYCTNGRYLLNIGVSSDNLYKLYGSDITVPIYDHYYSLKEYQQQVLNAQNGYLEYQIKNNIITVFLLSFFMLYIIRPLFWVFKGMIKEVS